MNQTALAPFITEHFSIPTQISPDDKIMLPRLQTCTIMHVIHVIKKISSIFSLVEIIDLVTFSNETNEEFNKKGSFLGTH